MIHTVHMLFFTLIVMYPDKTNNRKTSISILKYSTLYSVSPNILAKTWNFKKLRPSFVDVRAMITTTSTSSCHWKDLKNIFLTQTVDYHRIVQRLYKHVSRSFSGQRRFLEIRPLWEILQTKKRPHGKNLWFFHLGTPKTAFLMKNLHIDPHNLDVFPIGSHIRLKICFFVVFFVTYFFKQGCHRILI